MKTYPLLLVSVFAVAAGGCAIGPDYHRPAVSVPEKWNEPLAGGESNAPASLAGWWKKFHDPELDSLIARAVPSNLDVRIAEARVREARAQYGIAVADLGPAASASGSYARLQASHHQPVIGSLPLPPSVPFENDVYQAGTAASWEIDVFGGKRRAREAAQAEVGASVQGQNAVVLVLLGDVARSYIEVRGLQRRLTIAHDNIKAQEQALAITRDRFAHGLSNDLDVEQAATLLETTRAGVPTLETALQVSIHRLGVLLGQSPGALLAELSTEAPIPAAPPEVPVGLPSDLLLRRPDVQRAERELAAATAKIGVAKSDLFPKFSLTGAVGYESVGTGDWFTSGSRFWSLGPSIQWRIFDAGRVRANIKVQDARQERALAAYEQTVLVAFEEVENSLVAYANEQVRHRSLVQAVNSSRKSLDLADRLYASGLTDFLHVLDAERVLYRTQDQLVQSESTLSTNLVSLYKALGGGWETQVTPVNPI